jgi:AraC-like DNA-binding protein
MSTSFYRKVFFDFPDPYQEIYFLSIGPDNVNKQANLEEHNHLFYQMDWVMDGTLLLMHNGKRYPLKKGQLCIIPPLQNHAFPFITPFSEFGMKLSPDYDQRGIIDLLQTHVKEVVILEKGYLLDKIPLLDKECGNSTSLSKIKVASALDELLCSCVENRLIGEEIEFKNKLVHYLSTNLSQKISLQDISKELAVSRTQLERLSRKLFRCGTMEFFHQMRLHEACSLLSTSDLSIDLIATCLGFYDHAHFSHNFKKRMNMSPSQYRSLKIWDN